MPIPATPVAVTSSSAVVSAATSEASSEVDSESESESVSSEGTGKQGSSAKPSPGGLPVRSPGSDNVGSPLSLSIVQESGGPLRKSSDVDLSKTERAAPKKSKEQILAAVSSSSKTRPNSKRTRAKNSHAATCRPALSSFDDGDDDDDDNGDDL